MVKRILISLKSAFNTRLNLLRQNLRGMLSGLGSTFAWYRCVKSSNALMSGFLRISALVQGKVTRSVVLGCLDLLRAFHAIGRRQGPEGLARYLKACSIYVMRYVAGDALHNSFAFGLSVSLTRGGLPRILPVNWRRRVTSGDIPAIRLTLTFLNLYRVLEFKGKLDVSTITSPGTGTVNPRLKAYVPLFVSRFLPPGVLNPLRWDPIPILNKGAHVHNAVFGPSVHLPKHGWTSQGALASALASIRPFWSQLGEFARLVGLRPEFQSFSSVWSTVQDLAWPVGKDFHWGTNPDGSPILFNGELPVELTLHAHCGRLACKDEPGKVRVFAMVDALTQWFMYPLHQRIFSLLRTLETDATFDQGAAVERIRSSVGSKTKVFSFDLSAATDRLPVSLQADILSAWHRGLGEVWKSLLVDRVYILPARAMRGRANSGVKYAVGQPMGAYSSWAMLALTHHLVVQYAAQVACAAGPKQWFKDYCVLGDDIVIWEERTAKAYRAAMLELGVNISPSKSLSSGKGVFEFAKRFVVAGDDATALPLAAIAASSQNLAVFAELLRRLPQRSLAVIMRFLGFGYKVRGALSSIEFSNTRRSFAAFWALQPGVCRESAAAWSSWFVTKGPGRGESSDPRWFEILYELAAYCYKQVPKMPAEVPFFFQRAYMAELEGSVGSQDSLFPGVPWGRIPELEIALASLFHGSYSELFVRNREAVRSIENRAEGLLVPVGPQGVEVLMRFLREVVPASALLSTGTEQSPAWREYHDPDPLREVSVASFIRLRMKTRKFLK